MSGPENGNAKLTLPFGDIARATLPIAGDKAANLGELPGPGCRCPPVSACLLQRMAGCQRVRRQS